MIVYIISMIEDECEISHVHFTVQYFKQTSKLTILYNMYIMHEVLS